MNQPEEAPESATVERRIERPVPDLLAKLRQLDNLPNWYDDWDAVTPDRGFLDAPGTRFTLVRFRAELPETASCIAVEAAHCQQLCWIEDVDAPVATMVTFDLSAPNDSATVIRYTRTFVQNHSGSERGVRRELDATVTTRR